MERKRHVLTKNHSLQTCRISYTARIQVHFLKCVVLVFAEIDCQFVGCVFSRPRMGESD